MMMPTKFDTSFGLREPGWVTLTLIGISIIFVTVIGYFDEGHYRIYAGFGDYLIRGGVPPLSDYILWGVIFTAVGQLFYQLQNLLPAIRNAFFVRLVLTALGVPVFVLGLLTLLMIKA